VRASNALMAREGQGRARQGTQTPDVVDGSRDMQCRQERRRRRQEVADSRGLGSGASASAKCHLKPSNARTMPGARCAQQCGAMQLVGQAIKSVRTCSRKEAWVPATTCGSRSTADANRALGPSQFEVPVQGSNSRYLCRCGTSPQRTGPMWISSRS
jgi:hypothetical protein